MLQMHKALELMNNFEKLSQPRIGFAQTLCYIYHVNQKYEFTIIK
jgi:hypothetical protein